MKKPIHRVDLRLDEETFRELAEVAKRESRSLNGQAVFLVRLGLRGLSGGRGGSAGSGTGSPRPPRRPAPRASRAGCKA